MMHGAVFGGVIRFVCHIPLFIFGFQGLGIWKLVQQHADTVLAPPLESRTLDGLRIGGCFGIFAFAWNFSMWLPNIVSPDGPLFFLGLVDAMIVFAIIYATHVQRSTIWANQFVTCSGIESPPAKGEEDIRLLFFGRLGSAAESKEETQSFAVSNCKGLRMIFNLGITIMVLYGILAVANIVFGIIGIFNGRSCLGRRITYSRFYHAIVITPARKFQTLSIFIVKGVVFYSIRLVSRAKKRRTRASTEYVMLTSRSESPYTVVRSSPIKQYLTYDILTHISPYLHYADIVSLSSTSRHLRLLVFHQSPNPERDRATMRRITCGPTAASPCELCGIQTCGKCQVRKRLSETSSRLHGTLCEPMCFGCNWRIRGRTGKILCACGDARRKDFEKRLKSSRWARPAWLSSTTQGLDVRGVCSRCSKLHDSDLISGLDEEDKKRLRSAGDPEKELACAICRKFIKGSIWWRCKRCGGDCHDVLHAQWR